MAAMGSGNRRKWWPNGAFLRNKLARRIFMLFIFCTLVPLTVLAVLSYWEVTSQLDRQEDERLHQECKALAMTLAERISLIEADLSVAATSAVSSIEQSHQPFLITMHQNASKHLKWLMLQSEDGLVLGRSSTDARPLMLTAEEREHLKNNPALLSTRSTAGSNPSILLAERISAGAWDGRLLVGEIEPFYLFAGEGLLLPNTELAVLTMQRQALFTSQPERVPTGELEKATSLSSETGKFEWDLNGDSFIAAYWTLFLRPTYGDSWMVIVSTKKEVVVGPLQNFKNLFILIMLLSLWIVALISIRQIRRHTTPIDQLRDATQKITTQDFTTRVSIRTGDELEELGKSFNSMAESLGAHAATMEIVNRIGKSLTAEKQEAQLLKIILHGTKKLTHADGGALYLVSEGQGCRLAIMEVDSLGIFIENDPLFPEEAQWPFPGSVLGKAGAQLGEGGNPDLEFQARTVWDEGGQSEFDRKTGYQSKSWLNAPLRNHENEVIGILWLANATDEKTQTIQPFSADDLRLAESLVSQAAIALTKNRLVNEFRRLFEGLVTLIATAVDAKSPYTSQHSERVHLLTMMIAEAACNATEGPLKKFSLSDAEMYELSIAAQLHDCGKVATPVHIIDKATKLQTIIDRMQLIENRFEILLRDHQIMLLKKKFEGIDMNGPQSMQFEIDDEMEQYKLQLRADVDFLRKYNQGDEFMPETARQRVQDIAEKYQWTDIDNNREGILETDEVKNLCIERGTLNEDERRLINEHADLTFRMLNSLHYPRQLKNIPSHAAAHHERVDGRGYPFGLKRDQISLQGRMIGLADVFEALTARDRPYKASKSLDEVLKIMQMMKEGGHIDPDLYEIFIKNGIHINYALKYLDPNQWNGSFQTEEQSAEALKTCSV